MVYRFVGAESTVGNLTMRRFGQRFNMQEKVAETCIKGGCALIPEEEFNAIGFTEEDMKVWSDPMVRDGDVPSKKEEAERKSAFITKRAMARERFVEIRHALLDPEDKPNTSSASAPVETPAITEIAEEVAEEA